MVSNRLRERVEERRKGEVVKQFVDQLDLDNELILEPILDLAYRPRDSASRDSSPAQKSSCRLKPVDCRP